MKGTTRDLFQHIFETKVRELEKAQINSFIALEVIIYNKSRQFLLTNKHFWVLRCHQIRVIVPFNPGGLRESGVGPRRR